MQRMQLLLDMDQAFALSYILYLLQLEITKVREEEANDKMTWGTQT